MAKKDQQDRGHVNEFKQRTAGLGMHLAQKGNEFSLLGGLDRGRHWIGSVRVGKEHEKYSAGVNVTASKGPLCSERWCMAIGLGRTGNTYGSRFCNEPTGVGHFRIYRLGARRDSDRLRFPGETSGIGAARLSRRSLRPDANLRVRTTRARSIRLGKITRRRHRRCNNRIQWSGMALVVFFRGINVGGHRRLRPSILARELKAYDVVNVGTAGTFVVRKPGSRASFLAELRRKLPFEAEIAFCDGNDLLRLEMEKPFGSEPTRPDAVQFLSILSKAGRCKATSPIAIPEGQEWFVQIIGWKSRLVFGVYRRHMKTIGYLGQLDEIFRAPATTRSWTTILSVLRILRA